MRVEEGVETIEDERKRKKRGGRGGGGGKRAMIDEGRKER